MLTLVRRNGEKIRITAPPSADPTIIEVELVHIQSYFRAKIGISAPLTTRIDREEIARLKDAENSAEKA